VCPGQLLSSEEADKAVRIARVTARAQQVFAVQPAYAAAWLREPKSSLGNRTPLQLLATESGALAVEEQLIGGSRARDLQFDHQPATRGCDANQAPDKFPLSA
jgi:putative toxin-antitoxin system antitoxin component (TIGR02293 family)